MSFRRDMTVSDVERLELSAADADVAFQMDEDTFRAFYDRTSRILWAYLTRITGDRQLADDLLQETYYRFLRAGTTYDSEAHCRNSLFRIATNVARDGHRRTMARPVHVPHNDELADPRDGADLAERVTRSTDLTRAMARLKPRERQLLWLAYAQGSSHREIANVLGLKSASIRLLLFRARRRLAAFLGGSSAPSMGGSHDSRS
jgi:RNA polymerase sigma-70 factor (ECF subfamily)